MSITIESETLRDHAFFRDNRGGRVRNVRTFGPWGHLALRDCQGWTIEGLTCSGSRDGGLIDENFRAIRRSDHLTMRSVLCHSGYRGIQIVGAGQGRSAVWPDHVRLEDVLFSRCDERSPTIAGSLDNQGGQDIEMRRFVIHDSGRFAARFMRGVLVKLSLGVIVPTERSRTPYVDTMAGTQWAGEVEMVDVYVVRGGQFELLEGSDSSFDGAHTVRTMLASEMDSWGCQPSLPEERRIFEQVRRDAGLWDRPGRVSFGASAAT